MLRNTQLVIMHFLLIRPSVGLPRSASGYSISWGLLHTCHSGREAPQGICSSCDRQCSLRRDCQIFTTPPSFSAQRAHCYRYLPLTAKENHVTTRSVSELGKYTPAKGSHDKDGERKNCEQNNIIYHTNSQLSISIQTSNKYTSTENFKTCE